MRFSIHPFRRFPMQCSVRYNAGPFLTLPLTYFWGFWSLITLLILSSGPAYAEWEVLVENAEAGMTVYVDPGTIRRKGDLVKMWELLDFKTIQTVAGKSFLSSKVQSEFDCLEEQSRELAFWHLSNNLGGGKVVASNSNKGEWYPVAPVSISQHLWKFACGKK
mgnify:CR=1 FL=1